MKILVQFPTRSRPEKFRQMLPLWKSPLVNIHAIIDVDDRTMNNAEMTQHLYREGVSYDLVPAKGKIAAMNYGLAERDWNIVVVAQDDLVPEPGYAGTLLALWHKHFGESTDGLFHLHDGRQTRLNTIVVMGRQYFDRFGYVYHPSYKSLWADDEYTDVSEKLGRVVRINRKIITHKWAGEHPDDLLRLNESFWDADAANYRYRKMMGFPK